MNLKPACQIKEATFVTKVTKTKAKIVIMKNGFPPDHQPRGSPTSLPQACFGNSWWVCEPLQYWKLQEAVALTPTHPAHHSWPHPALTQDHSRKLWSQFLAASWIWVGRQSPFLCPKGVQWWGPGDPVPLHGSHHGPVTGFCTPEPDLWWVSPLVTWPSPSSSLGTYGSLWFTCL